MSNLPGNIGGDGQGKSNQKKAEKRHGGAEADAGATGEGGWVAASEASSSRGKWCNEVTAKKPRISAYFRLFPGVSG
jgi:hypothetical protein